MMSVLVCLCLCVCWSVSVSVSVSESVFTVSTLAIGSMIGFVYGGVETYRVMSLRKVCVQSNFLHPSLSVSILAFIPPLSLPLLCMTVAVSESVPVTTVLFSLKRPVIVKA